MRGSTTGALASRMGIFFYSLLRGEAPCGWVFQGRKFRQVAGSEVWECGSPEALCMHGYAVLSRKHVLGSLPWEAFEGHETHGLALGIQTRRGRKNDSNAQ